MHHSNSNDEFTHNINELNTLKDEETHWFIKLLKFLKSLKNCKNINFTIMLNFRFRDFDTCSTNALGQQSHLYVA